VLILNLALRNLLRHSRKTFLLFSLVALGIAALFFANAVFAGTDDGLRRSLIGSLTGRAVVSAAADTVYGLFGSELPIVSAYENIPPISSFDVVWASLHNQSGLGQITAIVSTAAAMKIGRLQQTVPIFGVNPDTYFSVCSDIEIVSGNPAMLADGGVFLNEVLAGVYERALKRPLKIGELVAFSSSTGSSFRLRSAPFAGVHRYSGNTEVLNRIVLTDLVTARSLAAYTLGFAEESELGETDAAVGDDAFDLDSLFGSASDIETSAGSSFDLQGFEAELSETSERDSLVLTDSGAWSFILLKGSGDTDQALAGAVRSAIADYPEVRYLSWRTAAGTSATVVFAVQILFYIGLGFIAAGAVLVIMNSLVLSVLERRPEIGTMRSLGASGAFISRLFVTESLLLTISATVAGLLLGVLLVALTGDAGVPLSNTLLITLFGGNFLVLKATFMAVVAHLGLGALVGALAWIYPVLLAVRVRPLSAMNKE